MKTEVTQYRVELSDLETINHPAHVPLREVEISVMKIGVRNRKKMWAGEAKTQQGTFYFHTMGWRQRPSDTEKACFKSARECFEALKNGIKP